MRVIFTGILRLQFFGLLSKSATFAVPIGRFWQVVLMIVVWKTTRLMNKPSCRADINPSNDLGLQERELLMLLNGPQERLDYPTEILKMSNGCEVEKYIIPEMDKEKVLEALYPFNDLPALDDERLDLHTGKTFRIRDYIVTREGSGNFLVTPFYAEKGGTVLDWVEPTLEDSEEMPTVNVKTIRK